MALHRATARPTAVRSLAILAAFALSGAASIGFGLLFAARWAAVPEGGLGVLAQGRFAELVALAAALGVAVVGGYLCVIFLLLLVGDIAARAGRRLGAIERAVLLAAPPMLRATLATALGAGMILTVSTGGASAPEAPATTVAVAASTGSVAGVETDSSSPHEAVDGSGETYALPDSATTGQEGHETAGGELDRSQGASSDSGGSGPDDDGTPVAPSTDEDLPANRTPEGEQMNDSTAFDATDSLLAPGGIRPSMAPVHIVRPGDSLWTIARDHLPTEASTGDVNTMWQAWYSANRTAIGSDPGLLRPGTALRAPADSGVPSESGLQPGSGQQFDPSQSVTGIPPSATTSPSGSDEPDDRSDP